LKAGNRNLDGVGE